MLKVGLTGNIASGKSTVTRLWRELGAHVVDADVLARRAVEPESPGLDQIVQLWGPGVLDPTGKLDRSAMRMIVFNDPGARAALEEIIHPRVAELRDQEFAAAERAGVNVIVADIPLLFEADLTADIDVIVLVDAPEDTRRDRIIQDRGLSRVETDRMMAAQLPSARKRPHADIVIDNTGSLAELREAAKKAWAEVTRIAEDRR